MINNRQYIIVFVFLLCSCAGQTTPIISTVEGGTTASTPLTTASSEAPLFFTDTPVNTLSPEEKTTSIPTFTPVNTLSPEEKTTSNPTFTPVNTLSPEEKTTSNPLLFVPVTGPTQESKDNAKSDKFKGFKIPVSEVGFYIPTTGFRSGIFSDLSNIPLEIYSDISISLEIPALSIYIPIVGVPLRDGRWNVSWLWNQAGWLEGSAFPSWNGNSVITGHVYLSNGKPGPFAKLHELKTGDEIIVHGFGQKNIFEVLTNAIVAPNDKSVMRHEEKPWLTLITCKDYDQETDTYKNRFIVRSVLIEVVIDK